MKSIKPFLEWAGQYPEKHRALADQTPIVGYFCSYTPIELIHASGFLPVRILGESGPRQKVYSLIPSFICLYMGRALEKAIEGRYDYLTGVVQGYTCDVACGLTNIWAENIRLGFYHTLPLPYNHNENSRSYFRSALLALVEGLKTRGGRFSLESLATSLSLYRRIRSFLENLYDRRYQGCLSLSSKNLLTVVIAGFVTPPERYLSHLEDLVREIDGQGIPRKPQGFPVLISGSLIEDPRVLETLETMGFNVVADDLCTGLRSFYPPEGQGGDPLETLMDRYYHHFPCPARSRAKERFPLLMDLVKRSEARGVIFLLQKFCTPHLADYPLLAEAIRAEGLPHILLEMEDSGLTEAHRTRLEAFREIYGQGY